MEHTWEVVLLREYKPSRTDDRIRGQQERTRSIIDEMLSLYTVEFPLTTPKGKRLYAVRMNSMYCCISCGWEICKNVV